MLNVREILDEVFYLMELQVSARENSTSGTETEDGRQRAERLEELLGKLLDAGPHNLSQ
jgi:hypothetical protein